MQNSPTLFDISLEDFMGKLWNSKGTLQRRLEGIPEEVIIEPLDMEREDEETLYMKATRADDIVTLRLVSHDEEESEEDLPPVLIYARFRSLSIKQGDVFEHQPYVVEMFYKHPYYDGRMGIVFYPGHTLVRDVKDSLREEIEENKKEFYDFIQKTTVSHFREHLILAQKRIRTLEYRARKK